MRAEDHSNKAEGLLLVLLPGTLCDARIFAPLRQHLAAHRTEVILTLQTASLEEAAEEVLAQAPERFALLGFSLGGMVAMETALCAPERVRGLVLLSTTPLPVPPERHADRRAAVGAAERLGMRQYFRERLWPEYGGAEGDTRTLPLLEQMADDLGAAVFASQTEMALGRSDFCPRLRAIACPVLAIAGSADALCPPGAQDSLLAALPASRSLLLAGAGHFALIERADEVAAGVAAWLNEL